MNALLTLLSINFIIWLLWCTYLYIHNSSSTTLLTKKKSLKFTYVKNKQSAKGPPSCITAFETDYKLIFFLLQHLELSLDYSIQIMISMKCMIAGLGRGWNSMKGFSLCTRLNDRVYINMKSIQLPLMELSGVILYPVISGLWGDSQ